MKRVELYNDHFQNFKVYGIPHAQLIIADPPYNLGKNAYASEPTRLHAETEMERKKTTN